MNRKSVLTTGIATAWLALVVWLFPRRIPGRTSTR
jgi:hypothetical protein